MKFIEPTTPTLLSTSVAADPAPEWAAGTTYDFGDVLKVTSEPIHKRYRALRGLNTGHYPPDNTEPLDIPTLTGEAITVGTGTFNLTVEQGKEIPKYTTVRVARQASPNRVYMDGEVRAYDNATGDIEVNVFASQGEGLYSGWDISTIDATGLWEEVGATNQYACLDAYVNTQTTDDETITMRLGVERVDHVALFMLEGASVTLTLYDETETTILSQQTISLLYEASFITEISDWYEYFFGEYDYIDTCDASLGVLAVSAVLKIEITPNDSAVAAVGQIVVGRLQDGGTTISVPSAAIQDYSYRETDEEGRTTVKEGYWAKLNSVSCAVENIRFDWLYRKLAKLRATPTAWLAADDLGDWEALTVYGYYRDLEMEARTIDYSYYTLEIEGLI
jgi:hypothetical protein